jgi:hypothetical protein
MKIVFVLCAMLFCFSGCKKCYECATTNSTTSEQCFSSSTAMADYEQTTGDVCVLR